MAILRIVAGPNGSGKSTLTATFPPEQRRNLVDPDAIARDLNPLDPFREAIQAGREAIRRWRMLLEHREDFLVETTLAGNAVVSLMQQARDLNYRVLLTYVALGSPEMHIERVRLRVQQGGHDIPEQDIRRRYDRSLAQLPRAVQIADEAMIFDNTGFKARQLFWFQGGQLIYRSEDLPPWCADLQNRVGFSG